MSAKSEDIAISVSSLGKCYQIYSQPKDRLKQMLNSPLSRLGGIVSRKQYFHEFWALRDISIEIKRGEVIGIIGQNGSGKSTFLQLVCGTLTPTNGEVRVNGRVAALLELGAGFNPEFSGRENVRLNCAVMGLSQKEIEERMDKIIEFADIGEFIDQPVKTYSSGMHVRLAFAAAINVDPDILVVDEALAVGDARFQLKCFTKLENLKAKGTTILFVTHGVDMIKSFCSRGVLLDKGKMLYCGEPQEAVVRYYDLLFPKQADVKKDTVEASVAAVPELSTALEGMKGYCLNISPEEQSKLNTFGKGGAVIDWIKIYGLEPPNIFKGGDKLDIFIKYSWDKEFVKSQQFSNGMANDIGISVALANHQGTYMFGCNTFDAQVFVDSHKYSTMTAHFQFTMPYLMSGDYFITSAIAIGTQDRHIQLRWYDYFLQLLCISKKRYVFGVCHLDYKIDLLGSGS